MNDLQRAEIREALTYETPFWAGGITRRRDGSWRYPKANEFQGVAKVVSKSRRLVPLIASPWQLEFDELLERQRAAGQPMRAIVLKARQLGLLDVDGGEDRAAPDDAALPERGGRRAPRQGCRDDLRDDPPDALAFAVEQELGLGFSVKPDIIAKSFSPNGRKFIEFGEQSTRLRAMGRDGSSLLDIDTAESPEAVRGETKNLVHLSEFAKWPERATSGMTSKMASVLNAVPYEPETMVVLEFTAHGLNHAYRRWIAAKEGAGDPMSGETYAALFVPWWREPGYQMAFHTQEARQDFVDHELGRGPYGEDEEMLSEVLGLTPEQLLWRRMQIRTQHGESLEAFKQEYPATDEEAFIGSGNPVFPGILVARAIKQVETEPEPVVGTLRAGAWVEKKTRGGTIEIPTRAVWVPQEDMLRDELVLKVWEHPRSEAEEALLPESERKGQGQYVVGADFSEGQENTISVGDYHAIHVIDHVRKVQVAEHLSRADLSKLPLWVVLIGLYFNEAWLLPERNGPGIYVVEALKDYRYRMVYRPRRPGDRGDKPSNRIGWETTQATKPLMEGVFEEALADGSHGIRSMVMARQMNTYVADERGRHGAQPGEHDDALIAGMIARYGAVELQPRKSRKRRQRFEPEDELTGY
jgi:hypothetical protein